MIDERNEAGRILELCDGNGLRAFELVQGQLGILMLRAQVMLSLSGIVITVTGFSGRSIAETSVAARILVVAGLLTVLGAAAVAVWGVLRLTWLTQALEDDIHATLVRSLGLRNAKSRSLGVALVLFVLGFALYCAAVAQLLLAA